MIKKTVSKQRSICDCQDLNASEEKRKIAERCNYEIRIIEKSRNYLNTQNKN